MPRRDAGVMVACSSDAPVRVLRAETPRVDVAHSYSLRIPVTITDPGHVVEDLTGTLAISSIGASTPTTGETPVTGQFFTRTGIVVLNIGEPGSYREYAIGDTRGEGRNMLLRMFTVRRGQGVKYERELWFDPKNEPQPKR